MATVERCGGYGVSCVLVWSVNPVANDWFRATMLRMRTDPRYRVLFELVTAPERFYQARHCNRAHGELSEVKWHGR